MQKFDSDMTLVEMVYVGEILALIILLQPDISPGIWNPRAALLELMLDWAR